MLTMLAIVGLLGAAALAVVGVPPIDLHGPLHRVGIMDPLCGGTRATYLLAHGNLRRAIEFNPGVPVLAVAAGLVLVRAGVGWTTGRWITPTLSRRYAIAVGVVALTALEINQQLHAALLTSPWKG